MQVRIDISQARDTMRKLAAKLSRDQIERATARAINHTMGISRTAASRLITSRYRLPAAGIKKRLPIGKATPRMLDGRIKASTKPIPLIAINGTRQTRKGVSVEIIKGKRSVIKGAFIQTTKAGRKGVFARGQHKADGSFEFRHKRIVKTGPDMPIEELSTVSTYTAGLSTPVQQGLRPIATGAYPNRLMHEMQNIIEGITT